MSVAEKMRRYPRCGLQSRTLTMHGPDGSVTPSRLMTYAVEFENVGEGQALGVYVKDVLDPALDRQGRRRAGDGETLDQTGIACHGERLHEDFCPISNLAKINGVSLVRAIGVWINGNVFARAVKDFLNPIQQRLVGGNLECFNAAARVRDFNRNGARDKSSVGNRLAAGVFNDDSRWDRIQRSLNDGPRDVIGRRNDLLKGFSSIWKGTRRFGVAALVGVTVLACPALANISPSRKDALAAMDDEVRFVRSVMNSNSKEVENNLIWNMANPAGDDPRVLALCSEIIEKSTNTLSVWYAVRGVGGVIDAHLRRKTLNSASKKKIIAVLWLASTYNDHRVKMTAARQMERLGGTYRQEAFKLYLALLDNPQDASDVKKRRKNRIDAIRELFRLDGEKAADSIRKATTEDDLLKFFESQIPVNASPVVKEENKKFMEWWKRITDGGGNR